MAVNESEPTAQGSKTLSKGLRALSLIAARPHGLTVTELARELGVHRTVVYRLLLTLQEHELIEAAPNNRYVVGLGVVELARGVRGTLKDAARDVLVRLAEETGATAHLSVLTGAEVMSLVVVEPRGVTVHVAYQVGFRHPVDQGAAGLAILLGRPEQQGERAEVGAGRALGYVESVGELQARAWGLAAPVPTELGRARASVGVVALQRLEDPRVAGLVLAAAAEVGRRAGEAS